MHPPVPGQPVHLDDRHTITTLHSTWLLSGDGTYTRLPNRERPRTINTASIDHAFDDGTPVPFRAAEWELDAGGGLHLHIWPTQRPDNSGGISTGLIIAVDGHPIPTTWQPH